MPPKPKKRRLGQGNKAPEAKLFGGSIEEYVEATGEEIPLIVRSCVKVISMYGTCRVCVCVCVCACVRRRQYREFGFLFSLSRNNFMGTVAESECVFTEPCLL